MRALSPFRWHGLCFPFLPRYLPHTRYDLCVLSVWTSSRTIGWLYFYTYCRSSFFWITFCSCLGHLSYTIRIVLTGSSIIWSSRLSGVFVQVIRGNFEIGDSVWCVFIRFLLVFSLYILGGLSLFVVGRSHIYAYSCPITESVTCLSTESVGYAHVFTVWSRPSRLNLRFCFQRLHSGYRSFCSFGSHSPVFAHLHGVGFCGLPFSSPVAVWLYYIYPAVLRVFGFREVPGRGLICV